MDKVSEEEKGKEKCKTGENRLSWSQSIRIDEIFQIYKLHNITVQRDEKIITKEYEQL